MTATPNEGQVTEGARTLEVRWIFPGQPGAPMAEWLGRFPGQTESREDCYLVNPRLPGLSVKLRAGQALDVKVYRGSPGILEVAGRARGRLQNWQKWSFPLGPPSHHGTVPGGWQPVGKRRYVSRFTLADPPALVAAPWQAGGPGCTVELTEVRLRDRSWWSLGFEAAGPPGLLRSGLEAAAALVFGQALPGGVELGTGDSRSYAEWLLLRLGGSDPGGRGGAGRLGGTAVPISLRGLVGDPDPVPVGELAAQVTGDREHGEAHH
jgi:hypothetical protein